MFDWIKRWRFWRHYPRHLPHPASREFLQTREWQQLRYRALVRYGGRCMACGRTAQQGVVINVDHIKPRKHYPHLALDITNLQILCGDGPGGGCNAGKGNWDMTDWRTPAQKKQR